MNDSEMNLPSENFEKNDNKNNRRTKNNRKKSYSVAQLKRFKQLCDKYTDKANELIRAGELIDAEYQLQHAEHFQRILDESGYNGTQDNNKHDLSKDKTARRSNPYDKRAAEKKDKIAQQEDNITEDVDAENSGNSSRNNNYDNNRNNHRRRRRYNNEGKKDDGSNINDDRDADLAGDDNISPYSQNEPSETRNNNNRNHKAKKSNHTDSYDNDQIMMALPAKIDLPAKKKPVKNTVKNAEKNAEKNAKKNDNSDSEAAD